MRIRSVQHSQTFSGSFSRKHHRRARYALYVHPVILLTTLFVDFLRCRTRLLEVLVVTATMDFCVHVPASIPGYCAKPSNSASVSALVVHCIRVNQDSSRSSEWHVKRSMDQWNTMEHCSHPTSSAGKL